MADLVIVDKKVELLNTLLLVFFSLTDIYLVRGVKLAYVFCIPLFLFLFKKSIRLELKDFFLWMWFFSYFFSIGHIISLRDFVVVTVGQLVLFVVYYYFKSIKSYTYLKKINSWFQLVLYVLVAVGLVQIICYYLLGSTWGISHVTHGVGLPRMSGLSLEPDWYGVICMMACVFMGINILSKQIFFNEKLDWIVFIVSLGMLILSLTRAAWVSFFAVLCVFLIMSRNTRKSSKRRFYTYLCIAFPVIISGVCFLYFSKNELFLKLLKRLNVFEWAYNDGGAFNTRKNSISVMLYYFKQHPFTGNGVGSMNAVSANTSLLESLGYMYQLNGGRGNANIIITNLFDTGVLGTFSLIMFFCIQIKQMVQNYKDTKNSMQLVYIMILIGLLVDFQFNNGLRLLYVWIFLGLSSSLCRIHNGYILHQKNIAEK